MLDEIRPLPDEWSSKKLRYFVDQGMIELGRGNIISHNDMADIPGKYPVYSSSATHEGKIGDYGRYMFDEELITWSIDGGGRFFYRPKHKFSVTNVSGYLRLWTQELDYRWLYYLLDLQQRHLTFDYTYKAHPSVIVDRYEIYDVPIHEQRRIAEILDTADAAIRETERVIAKLRQIKQGLLHDLLTRGLDEAGQLRDPEACPEQFKDSAVGRIPRDWKARSLDEYTLASAFGPRFSSDAYNEQGNVATLRTTDMDDEGNINLSTMPIAELELAQFRSHLLKAGDLLISRSGTCGIASVFPGFGLPVLPGAFLIRFRLGQELLPSFAQNYFNSVIGRQRVLQQAQGGVQKNLQGTTLLKLLIPVPSLNEQNRIMKILNTHDARIRTEEEILAKRRQLKRGLMDDLLTGRVRV